jgi:RNA recognition motif-containing protein
VTVSVSDAQQLPWSTCNDDLVDLFSTIGKVERAEIQYEPNGRSRGTGVVQFDSPETAETSIGILLFLSLRSETMLTQRQRNSPAISMAAVPLASHLSST